MYQKLSLSLLNLGSFQNFAWEFLLSIKIKVRPIRLILAMFDLYIRNREAKTMRNNAETMNLVDLCLS